MEEISYDRTVMDNEMERIGVSDYISMTGVIVVCTLVGLYHSRKNANSKDIEGYLLGGRSMGIMPVAFSILATKVSGIAVAGGAGEEYLYGASYSLLFVGYFIGQLAVAQLIIPIFRRGTYVSIYEYWEKRFDKSIRIMFSLMYLISNVIYLGIVVYVPAVSITALTGIPYELMVFITGFTCTIYCVLGGYEAVIWTDVMQMLIIFLSFLLIMIKGTIDVGGIGVVWRESVDNNFFSSMTFSESTSVRYSILSLLACGIYTSFRDLGASQAGVQRILSVKTATAAKRTTLLSAILGIVFMVLLTAASVVLYADLHSCDPMMRSHITKVVTHDQIFVYGIVKFLKNIPCLSGVALSGLICSALSTFSSFINAFATITLEDYMKHLTPGLVDTEKKKILSCKILTGIYGGVTITFAFLVPFFGGAIKSTVSLLALFSGPMAGALILAAFVRRCNKKACLAGLFVSLACTFCIQVGGMLYKFVPEKIPHSLDNCYERNDTFPDFLGNYTFKMQDKTVPIDGDSVFPLFKISFMWYGPIGIVITVLVGTLASFLTTPEYVDPSLLHPLIAPYDDESIASEEECVDLKQELKEQMMAEQDV